VGKYSGTTANKFLNLTNERLGTYNAWDAYNTARLVAPLIQELKDNRQYEHYLSHVEPLQGAVIAMQSRGMLLNYDAKASYRQKLSAELRDVDRVIGEAYSLYTNSPPSTFNPNSNPQIAKLLFSPLGSGGCGLLGSKSTKTGQSVDQEALTGILRKLRKKDAHAVPLLHALFHRSRLQTILSRYLTFSADDDGMVRARVQMAKAKTFRLAYKDPPLQQWPPEVRHILEARPGHKFIGRDYSQLEARLMAYLANDTPSIEVFESGGDVHRANAQDLFGHSNITEGERDYSKGHLYKICYGGRGSEKEKTACPCIQWGCAEKLPAVVDLKRATKLDMERRWFIIHNAVNVFQRDLIEGVRSKHYYDHPLGGRRYFTAPWSSELEREVLNQPLQYGGATLMARAQISLHEEGAPIVLQMHDEFIFEVRDEDVEQLSLRSKEIMERPIPELGGISIPTDLEVGSNWGKWHKTLNPDGMRETTL